MPAPAPAVKVEPEVVKGEPGTEVAGVQVEQDPQPGTSTETETMLVPVKIEPGVVYEPITVAYKDAGATKYKYKCPLCVTPRFTRSKNGMRSHINEEHMKKPLLCQMCDYSTFNPDVLAKHLKTCGH